MESRIWTWIKNVGSVLAVLLALIQLWNWIGFQPSTLEMDLRYGAFPMPQAIAEEFTHMSDLLDPEAISKRIKLPRLLGDAPSQDVTRAADVLIRTFSLEYQAVLREAQIKPFRYLTGYWLATVRNNAPTALEAVTLFLPGTVYVSVTREGAEPRFSNSTEVIEVGTMRPAEVASVIAWSKAATSEFAARDARLTHKSGVGRVSLYVPVGAVGQLADRYWPLVVWMFFSLIVGFGIQIIGQYLSKRSIEKRSTTMEAEQEAARDAQKDARA